MWNQGARTVIADTAINVGTTILNIGEGLAPHNITPITRMTRGLRTLSPHRERSIARETCAGRVSVQAQALLSQMRAP